MIEIRDGQPGDAHAIAAVQVESWRTAYQGLLPERVLASLSVLDREQNWSTILVDPPPRTAIVLARSNAVVVGFVAIGPDQDTTTAGSPAGQLYAIYVRSDQRGRGIGTQLQHAALDRLRTLGFTHAVLWVLEGNERAIRFYRRHGWLADGARRVDKGPQDVDLPELRLRRTLSET